MSTSNGSRGITSAGQKSRGNDEAILLLRRLHRFITTYLRPEFLTALGLLSLFFGGLIFLVYVWHIGFMPEVDLNSFLTLLAACALAGGFLIVLLSMTVVGPGWTWRYYTQREEGLKSPWWFGIPALFLMLGFLLMPTWTGFWHAQKTLRWWLTILFLVITILPVPLLLSDILWHLWLRFLKKVTDWLKRHFNSLSIPPPPAAPHSSTIAWSWANYQGTISEADSVKQEEGNERLDTKRTWKQRLKSVWVFLKGFVVSGYFVLILLLLVFQILEEHPGPGPFQYPRLITFVIMLGILIWNVLLATRPLSVTEAVAVAVLLMVFLFLTLPLSTLISNRVVTLFKFGNFNAALVLDGRGCAIARQDGVMPTAGTKTDATSASGTCLLPDVTVLSGLGNTYYFRYASSKQRPQRTPEPEPVCFTLPGQDVLSWKVLAEIPGKPCQYRRPTKAPSGG
jgi:MFS family permease